MTEKSEKDGHLSITEQIEAGVIDLEALSGSEVYDHATLMTGYNTVATLVDEALAAGELDQAKAAEIKLAASTAAKEIATNGGDVDSATTLGQLADAHTSVIELLEAVQTQTPADTSRARTGSAKSRI